MRYLAQRVGTGAWLDRNLPLSGVERSTALSGPGSITATVEPEMWTVDAGDGLRLLEGWGTILYAAEDDGQITDCGLVMPPITYEGASTSLTAAGFATYPHGYYYDSARLWGPKVGTGTVTKPQYPRPDPVKIMQDHWAWIQDQTDSDLGVTFVGDLKSTVQIGSYEEPYRLQPFEYPDLGQQIDDLAAQTPFDYVEEHEWADSDHRKVEHRIRVGFPRLGARRDDLRFADGENIAEPVSTSTSEDFANDVIGVGKGNGSQTATARSYVRDGRLRRTRILTDKTATEETIARRTILYRERLSRTLDVTEVSIIDHPNARISEINLGDDVFVQTEVPAYGEVAMWVRVLGITRGDNPSAAVLNVSRSSGFFYNTTEELT